MNNSQGKERGRIRFWKVCTGVSVAASGILVLASFLSRQTLHCTTPGIECGYSTPYAGYTVPLLVAAILSYVNAFIFTFKGWPLRGHQSIPSD